MSANEEYTINSILPRFYEILKQLDADWAVHKHDIKVSQIAAEVQRSFATSRTVMAGLLHLRQRVRTLNARIRSLQRRHNYRGPPQIFVHDILDSHLSESISTQTAPCQLRYIISESTAVLESYEESVVKEENRITGLLSWSRQLLVRLQCLESEGVFRKLLSLVDEKSNVEDRMYGINVCGTLAGPDELEDLAALHSELEDAVDPHRRMIRLYDSQMIALSRAIQEMGINIPRQRMITEFFRVLD